MSDVLLKGLRTVIYRVSDLEKSKQWYSRIFGLAPYFDQPFYVGFNVGGYELGLDPDKSEGPTGKGGVGAYWGVEDASAAYANALGHGATSNNPPNDVGGGIIVASILDPDGNVIGLIENPHFVAGQ